MVADRFESKGTVKCTSKGQRCRLIASCMGNLGLSMLNKDAANHVQLDCGDRLLIVIHEPRLAAFRDLSTRQRA